MFCPYPPFVAQVFTRAFKKKDMSHKQRLTVLSKNPFQLQKAVISYVKMLSDVRSFLVSLPPFAALRGLVRSTDRCAMSLGIELPHSVDAEGLHRRQDFGPALISLCCALLEAVSLTPDAQVSPSCHLSFADAQVAGARLAGDHGRQPRAHPQQVAHGKGENSVICCAAFCLETV